MKGRKEVSVDVSNRKSITGMMTGTKDDSQGGVHSSNKKSAKNSLENCIKFDYKCVCLNARSILHKRNELNIMVEDIYPHIIGISESWATINISDAESGITGYAMFRKDKTTMVPGRKKGRWSYFIY